MYSWKEQSKKKLVSKCSPATWWGGLCYSSLSCIARKLMQIPSSSAAAERDFSAFPRFT